MEIPDADGGHDLDALTEDGLLRLSLASEEMRVRVERFRRERREAGREGWLRAELRRAGIPPEAAPMAWLRDKWEQIGESEQREWEARREEARRQGAGPPPP